MLITKKSLVICTHSDEKEGSHMVATGVTISSREYIVLPAKLRKEMNLKPGTRVLLTRENDKMIETGDVSALISFPMTSTSSKPCPKSY
jgi:AbrB family looped-hinge helix DNA binding protein